MLEQTGEKVTRAWVLVLTSVASFMVGLDALVVTTALSTIRLHLGASIEDLEWTVNAYTLSFAVLLMTGAALGDRFGRRRLFVVGLGLFVAASAACALSPNITILIAARAIQGCGSALVMPLAVTQLSLAFPPEQRAKALGAFSGVAGLAVLSGPVVGGAIAGGLAWQWIFWLNVPIGLLVIPLVLVRLPESFGARMPLDIGGLLLVTGAALGLVWGLVRGNQAGWGSIEVVATLVAGCLLTVAFVFWERRARMPMLPLRFFRSRAFSVGNVAGFLFFASLYGSSFFLAQFLQTVLGYGPLETGLRLLPWTGMLFVSAPLGGLLTNRLGERVLMVGALFLQAGAFAWIALIARPGLAYPELVVPLIIAGCGVSAIPVGQNAVVSSVRAKEIGKASGAFNMLRQLGAAFGIAIVAAVFAGVGSYSSAQAFSKGFAWAMGVSATFALVGAIIGLLLPGRSVIASVQTTMQERETGEPEAYRVPEQSTIL
jgi:EmrB/QacA subfamily drug resistance transporter